MSLHRFTCRSCVGVAPNERLYGLAGFGYLGAVAPPDKDREALVSKLAVIMGDAEARKTVGNLESLVQKRASDGATKVVVKALWGFVILNVAGYLWKRRNA